MSSLTRSKSLRKDCSHPISSQGREIILQCFENPHSEFGNKVLQRIFEKRVDYQKYVYALGKERTYQMSVRLKDLVEEVVSKIFDPDYICEASRAYGEEHVELKMYGFKPDFWVTIADAITIEGVILDMANHQPADTVAAWSQLVAMMFSAVRDGYYSALRRHRMSSKRCLQRQATQEGRNTNGSVNVMAPVSSRERAALLEARSMNGSMRISRTQDRTDTIAGAATPSGTSTNRPRPIFE
uniref:GLOBIN domain-containing protein n=1 Tax=Angiostrongylus cantonensis TaxID=6313 RepID=A0A0K0DPJ5_ANGCA